MGTANDNICGTFSSSGMYKQLVGATLRTYWILVTYLNSGVVVTNPGHTHHIRNSCGGLDVADGFYTHTHHRRRRRLPHGRDATHTTTGHVGRRIAHSSYPVVAHTRLHLRTYRLPTAMATHAPTARLPPLPLQFAYSCGCLWPDNGGRIVILRSPLPDIQHTSSRTITTTRIAAPAAPTDG